MDNLKALQESIEKNIILNPKYHDPLVLVKAIRNGLVYGSKVRFPHALVMIFLFRSGTVQEKIKLIYKATRQHATNLAKFALLYKSRSAFTSLLVWSWPSPNWPCSRQ